MARQRLVMALIGVGCLCISRLAQVLEGLRRQVLVPQAYPFSKGHLFQQVGVEDDGNKWELPTL